MPVADRRDAAGEDRRRSSLTSSSITNCCASWVSRPATCSSGACVQRPVREVDREVDAPGERAAGRATRYVIDALHGQLLEVRAADVEQERQLAVVDRHLGDGGVDRREPERQPGAVAAQIAAAVAQDVGRRLGAEVADAPG